jgi:hypothetical protein
MLTATPSFPPFHASTLHPALTYYHFMRMSFTDNGWIAFAFRNACAANSGACTVAYQPYTVTRRSLATTQSHQSTKGSRAPFWFVSNSCLVVEYVFGSVSCHFWSFTSRCMCCCDGFSCFSPVLHRKSVTKFFARRMSDPFIGLLPPVLSPAEPVVPPTSDPPTVKDDSEAGTNGVAPLPAAGVAHNSQVCVRGAVAWFWDLLAPFARCLSEHRP